WWNMESIFGACTAVGLIKMNVGTYGGLPNPFISDEDSSNEEKNRRKMEEIWDDIKTCGNKLSENKNDLQYIYDHKIIPYEDKDDEYKTRASKLHSKYTNTWERFVELVKGYDTISEKIEKGVLASLVGLVTGIGGLIKGAIIYKGAEIGIKVELVTGDAPDCLKYCIDKADEYDKTIVTVLKDPTLIEEGIAQGVSDAAEEEGIAYCCGYAITEILQTIFISKGLDKVKDVSKVEKVTTKIDEVVDISKAEKDVLKVEEGVGETATGVSDVANKVKPSRLPDTNAVPEGKKTKIGKKIDDAERRSLERENDSADILAKQGYSIEQNPAAPEVAPKKPDYRIEGQLFDCFAPAEQTPIKNILSTINEKVNIKKQANRVIVNLQDWDGGVDDLARELVKNTVKNLEEVIVITKEGKAISIFP
ncbi:MAG: hypothetical protein H7Y18_10255, partial [Clostridiaceae bacterium]|nr:hypothetical protein [Clostridiaceae bacterium]